MAGLTIRGYARRRGVSHTAVRKALASGRITAGPDGSIDPDAADRQWAEATDFSKPRNSVTGVPGANSRRPSANGAGPARAATVADSREDEVGFPAAEGGGPRLASSYAASRAAREGYLARLAKLEFEKRSGKLVDADDVRAQIFALGRRMRDAMLTLPDRLAPVLAAEVDPATIHQILTREIIASLGELSVAPPVAARGEKNS